MLHENLDYEPVVDAKRKMVELKGGDIGRLVGQRRTNRV